VQGLTNAGYTVDGDIKNTYSTYLDDYKAKHPKKSFFEEFMNPTPYAPEFAVDNNLINNKAAASDIAIITIGRNAGEGSDRKVDNDFNLKAAEVKLIDDVSAAFHAKGKKVVVIINAGGVIEITSWRDKVDAILLAWQPGLEAGNAVADVLSGKINPSGKLATTFPVKYADDVTGKNFPGVEFPDKATTGMLGMKAIPAEVTYEEGIFVGYRYYNTFNVKPAYEFGYGLSYTSFEYSNLKLSAATFNGKIIATIDIKNTGKVAGKEVAQVYVTAPSQRLEKPAIELRAFGKTNLLQPGQQQTLRFELTAKDIASFDTQSTSWMAEAGKYIVKVGTSSEKILQTSSFSVPKDIMVEKCNKVLAPQIPISELKK
jgi:beta-glucosidase